jgi:hypothetical protein
MTPQDIDELMDGIDTVDLQTDLTVLDDGTTVTLYPNSANPLHKTPQRATYSRGYFYCDKSDPMDGPDYCFRDVLTYNVLTYNHGWKVEA